jgi:nitronate monooxygenase
MARWPSGPHLTRLGSRETIRRSPQGGAHLSAELPAQLADLALANGSMGEFMKTPLCRMLGIEHPIIAAPMGPDLTGPDLVAAVSNAGGLGILQAQFCPPPLFREEIRRVRALTDRAFGVNLLLHFPAEDLVAVCLEERVPCLSFFWGDPTPYVERAHSVGLKVLVQVGTVPEAARAAAAGVDVIVAQGVEAGGHVAGEVSTLALVPRVVDAVNPRPVAAAGGIADARGVVAALALGAQAAVLGTRFLASTESRAHPLYKQRLLEANEGDTLRTILFGHGWPNAPHRALRTAFVQEWLGREAHGQESRPDEPVVGQTVIGGRAMPVLRFMGFPPNRDASGDIDSMDLLAGQSVGLVREIKPAGEIVRELVEEARQIISRRLIGLVTPGKGGD